MVTQVRRGRFAASVRYKNLRWSIEAAKSRDCRCRTAVEHIVSISRTAPQRDDQLEDHPPDQTPGLPSIERFQPGGTDPFISTVSRIRAMTFFRRVRKSVGGRL